MSALAREIEKILSHSAQPLLLCDLLEQSACHSIEGCKPVNSNEKRKSYFNTMCVCVCVCVCVFVCVLEFYLIFCERMQFRRRIRFAQSI